MQQLTIPATVEEIKEGACSGCKNLKDYLNQKRMRLAEQLLRQHPDYTIEAIAVDCGLTLTTFKRLCKDMHGMSPSDYRKSLLQ